jgi:hypothetical protein
MGADLRVFWLANTNESFTFSSVSRSLTVWLLALQVCKWVNERLNNHGRGQAGRQIARDLGECQWRPPWISVLQVNSKIEIGNKTRGWITSIQGAETGIASTIPRSRGLWLLLLLSIWSNLHSEQNTHAPLSVNFFRESHFDPLSDRLDAQSTPRVARVDKISTPAACVNRFGPFGLYCVPSLAFILSTQSSVLFSIRTHEQHAWLQ